MRQVLAACLALALLGPCLGCGNVFVAFVSNPGEISGVVSTVHLSVVDDGSGTSITITVVTLINNGMSQTQSFCGNAVSQFPMNNFVVVSFRPGTPCGNIIAVHISG